ncbi:MAG TPA: nucleoside-diphosphate sugar epimerase/dehydratase [Terriglobales bacterium]|jgi:FlaA1/EpsC-like NDP-sugar epimerase|nr:nucleoside-diphosphate sugar epimerase/dehydratase [Terriglobales bacterium]
MRGLKLLWTKRYHVLIDLASLTAAFTISYLLRFDFAIPAREVSAYLRQLPYVVTLQFVALLLSGIYNFLWRYTGLREARSFVTATLYSSLPVLVLRGLLPDSLKFWRVPLSVIFADAVLVFLVVLGARVLRRVFYERSLRLHPSHVRTDSARKPVLLIGAGRAGRWAAGEIQNGPFSELDIRGFVDDHSEKQDSVIEGVRVLGTSSDLPRLVRELDIDHVIITIARASRSDFQRILGICEAIPVRVRVIPNLWEVLHGKLKISRIRDVQIEDLLGREPVCLERMETEHFIAGKVVMVTGAGGSIGSELVRQVARHNPRQLLLVERAEFALFQIDQEVRKNWEQLEVVTLVADVGSEKRMRQIFRTYRPQVVIHAAAHKHVPMMEENVAEAVMNNVLATYSLAQLSARHGVEAFVLISTDKAVNPTSVMGATKRIAELVVQHFDQHSATRYVAVRFGNVIGSTGSVIPIFQEQIRNGGPVTVTHPEMTRYFMTIPEAAQLVLEAAAMGQGGEIFVLDMGEPVRILDLAKEVITLTGLKPMEDIEIIFTGMRPGEKLFEELQLSEELMSKTRHPRIFIGKIAGTLNGELTEAIRRLAAICDLGEEDEIRRILSELIRESQLAGCKTITSLEVSRGVQLNQ